MNLSVIIPWRTPRQSDRREIAQWCFERYKHLWARCRIYFFWFWRRNFSRGKSINKGIADCTGDYCIVTDADYLFDFDIANGIINNNAWTVCDKEWKLLLYWRRKYKFNLKDQISKYGYRKYNIKSYKKSIFCLWCDFIIS